MKERNMKDELGLEICEIHKVNLVQAQGELEDHCPICRRIAEEDEILNDE